jgi:hypothetical protein
VGVRRLLGIWGNFITFSFTKSQVGNYSDRIFQAST